VLNIDGDPNGIIQHGHERVLRARFRDAQFFWTVDQKQPLRERVERLKNVTFQKDLGSYYDKSMRVQKLASQISQTLEDAGVKMRPGIVHKAALLAKTDLTTELVKEFTELQGIVGGLYAKAQGLDPAIGDAIYDQYKPESMEDAVPRTIEGAVLSMADKADSIAGMFALGLVPSGSKDPFALRRQANGIIKIIAEHKLPVVLDFLFITAREIYKGSEAEKKFAPLAQPDYTDHESDFYFEVSHFFRERLEFYLRDVRGFAYDVVNAVLGALGHRESFGSMIHVLPGNAVELVARAEAVAKVRPSEDFEAISAAFKRIKNILRQATETGKAIAPEFKADAAADDAERVLAQQVQRVAPRVRDLSQKRDYAGALAEIATIRPAVDTFFDKVMVMVEDERLRANRLALLQSLLNEFSTIADFSEIVTEKR
jgi:glycyl-tRNA synthetase beta chain